MKSLKLSKWLVINTVVISVLVGVASLLGLFSSQPYSQETANWLLQARGQDIGNLLAILVLLVSIFVARKGSMRAFYIWLGTLLYLIYAYLIYAVAVHFNSLFLIYVAVLGLSLFMVIYAVSNMYSAIHLPRINKFASYTLIGIGILFALLWLSEVIPAVLTNTAPQSLKDAGLIVNPIHVLDLSIVLPSFILTGYLASKNKSVGNYFLAPWLCFSVLMGSSIVAAMVLMVSEGFENTIQPLVMVSIVVALSGAALVHYLKSIPYK